MKMTYRKLKENLDKFTEEQLDNDVSIMSKLYDDEFYEMDHHIFFTTEEDKDDPSVGILDEGHPYLSLLR